MREGSLWLPSFFVILEVLVRVPARYRQECPAPFKPAYKVSRNRLIRRNPINSECLVPQATSGPFDLASVQASLLAMLCLRLRPVLARLQGQADMGALGSEYLRLSSAASTSASSGAGMYGPVTSRAQSEDPWRA